MARSGALSLVNDLKLYDYRGAGIIAPSSAAGTNGAGGHAGADGAISDSMMLLGGDAVAAAGQLAGAAASPLAAMLDQAVEELFVPYMEGIRYIDRESRSLADLYAGLLSRFISVHRAAATAKKDKGFAGAGNTIFNRMRNQISANPDASSSTSSFGSASTAATANTAATSAASTSKTSFFKLSNLADRVRGTHTAGLRLRGWGCDDDDGAERCHCHVGRTEPGRKHDCEPSEHRGRDGGWRWRAVSRCG